VADEKKPQSWWSTLPGVLTAVAAVITAVAGLLAVLHQFRAFEHNDVPTPPPFTPSAVPPTPTYSGANAIKSLNPAFTPSAVPPAPAPIIQPSPLPPQVDAENPVASKIRGTWHPPYSESGGVLVIAVTGSTVSITELNKDKQEVGRGQGRLTGRSLYVDYVSARGGGESRLSLELSPDDSLVGVAVFKGGATTPPLRYVKIH
jgi:hypothetical protein